MNIETIRTQSRAISAQVQAFIFGDTGESVSDTDSALRAMSAHHATRGALTKTFAALATTLMREGISGVDTAKQLAPLLCIWRTAMLAEVSEKLLKEKLEKEAQEKEAREAAKNSYSYAEREDCSDRHAERLIGEALDYEEQADQLKNQIAAIRTKLDKAQKSVRNSATQAVYLIEDVTGTSLKWRPDGEYYSVMAKPAKAEKQKTATGTGKGAAQNGVSVSQTGAGLEVKGDDISGDVADALAEIDSDTLLRELARRCPDRATLEIMVALLDDGAFSEPVNKQAASSAA